MVISADDWGHASGYRHAIIQIGALVRLVTLAVINFFSTRSDCRVSVCRCGVL